MIILDAQVHIWAADSPDRPWPRGGTPQPHRDQPWTADQMIAAMDAAGVDRAIIVPPSWEGDRNDLALAAVRAHPGRFAVMGRFDPLMQDPFELFPSWREQAGMLGVRFTFHSSRGRDLLADDSLARVWAAAERHGIPLMVRTLPAMFPTLANIAGRHPGLRLTLDHLAIPNGKVDAAAFAHLPALIALAQHPNIAVKASCTPFYTADAFPFQALHAPLRTIIDAFGAQRVFWGSDMTRLPCTYAQSVQQWTEHMPWLSGPALESIMGRGLAQWLDWAQ